MPRFIYNNAGDSMLMHLERELDHCSSFTFVIAFVTESALAALKVKLADLARHNIQGRILTADYLTFNAPKAFQELLKFENIEVRIADSKAFHAKGYIFDHADEQYQSVIIGSSNLTSGALMRNYEWNVKFTSHDNGVLTDKLISEVEKEWDAAQPLTNKWIDQYRIRYASKPKVSREELLDDSSPQYLIGDGDIKPNDMQRDALSSLDEVRKKGEHRALVISATGTGKTYLGALDVKNFQPKRFLYIVHREQILKKTVKSFQDVLWPKYLKKYGELYGKQTRTKFEAEFGIISGNDKNFSAKYLFATIQTLSRDEQLTRFSSNYFDYILIDEVHRAGASSYQKVVDHFSPNFLLGMTATPERMDDFNLYEMFDYNIAYEIRLQVALDADMLCPFRYIGITDYERDGEVIDDPSNLKWLVSEERVNYVVKQTEYYGYSGEVLRGLIFCSRTDEAYDLASALSARGYPSEAITGSTPQDQRDAIVQQLENDEISYIITVDVFNEGVDIPCVNQIVMLRNTQSSIVFVQQLGRGLRKFQGKDFVTVIDFIGNYKNNYLIPIALTGDKSRSKNNARDDLELKQVSGISTISFSEIAKERIYNSINNTALDSLKVLRDDYQDLKNRLGRIPLLTDFQQHGTVDSMVFANRFNNYYQFLLKMKEDIHLSFNEEAILSFISLELMNGKRTVELFLLQQLIKNYGQLDEQKFEILIQHENIFFDDTVKHSVSRVLSLDFFTTANQKKYGDNSAVISEAGYYRLNSDILAALDSNPWFKRLIEDAISVGLLRAKDCHYMTNQRFTLYQRYTRKDVCRLLGWENDVSSTVYGYRIRQQACPIFVTYSKSDEIEDSIKYEDRFINADIFQWYTRHNVKIDSKEVQSILDPTTTIHLFIKKSDDEGSDFYYFGEVTVESYKQETFQAKDKVEPIVKMLLRLKQQARYDKYLLFEK
ncbi:ATP-dependent RNA helicase DeaD [Lactiplantibacillus plajomi]